MTTPDADRDVLTVDLGGTQMRAAIVAPDGTIIEERKQPTPKRARCPDALLELAGDVLEGDRVPYAVIGVPGRVDYARGWLEHAPNLPDDWRESLREDVLADELGVPVSLANDADVAAVGEARFGAGRDRDDVAYLTISTGIGAGVVLGGRLVRGRRSLAELGHTIVDRTALRTEQPATLEDLGSGTALARAAEAAGLEVAGAELVALVEAGDTTARAVWDELVTVVAIGVINLAFAFSPEVVVLGGGVGRNGDLLLERVRSALRARGPQGLPDPIEVRTAALGDAAGLVGGAGWQAATSR